MKPTILFVFVVLLATTCYVHSQLKHNFILGNVVLISCYDKVNKVRDYVAVSSSQTTLCGAGFDFEFEIGRPMTYDQSNQYVDPGTGNIYPPKYNVYISKLYLTAFSAVKRRRLVGHWGPNAATVIPSYPGHSVERTVTSFGIQTGTKDYPHAPGAKDVVEFSKVINSTYTEYAYALKETNGYVNLTARGYAPGQSVFMMFAHNYTYTVRNCINPVNTWERTYAFGLACPEGLKDQGLSFQIRYSPYFAGLDKVLKTPPLTPMYILTNGTDKIFSNVTESPDIIKYKFVPVKDSRGFNTTFGFLFATNGSGTSTLYTYWKKVASGFIDRFYCLSSTETKNGHTKQTTPWRVSKL